MAKKKTKSVLDYDPLAWLNESDEEPKSSPKTKKASAKKTVKKTVKKAVKKVAKKAVKKAVGKTVKKVAKAKKETAKPDAKEIKENKPEVDMTTTENEGFGFFTEAEEAIVEENNEAEDGFGFFTNDDAGSNMVKDNTVEDNVSDEGFGFFSEDNKGPVLESNSEEEGFGFFADNEDDVLEVENMETLDISKDDAINLGSELTIKTVSEVKAKISNLLTSDVDIVINAEEMIKIDTAGLQLLYSLKESLSQTGHHIKWIGTSTVINDSAAIIGMPVLAPKTKAACFGFFEENMAPKDADDGSSGFF